METTSYLHLDGTLDESCKHKIPEKELVAGYEAMWRSRYIDERMVTLQRQGEISFAMQSLGEEGCVVASAAALKKEDWLYPQYREPGILFWRGYPSQSYIHQMFGNALDSIKGRQMPNHFGDRERNVVTVSSPLATQITHAAGAAYAMKIAGAESVALCYFGEGTASKGDFHAGLNIAATRSAPVIYFCRNNGYAISTALSDQYASEGIAPRAEGYGMLGLRVDGNCYFAVHEAVTKARQHCLEGKGPVLIEAMTYRLGAHSTSDDPSRYRDEKELEEWKKRDPLPRLRRYLELRGLWDEKREEEFLHAMKKEVEEAIEVAKKTSPPALETLIEDVYLTPTPRLRAQAAELQQWLS